MLKVNNLCIETTSGRKLIENLSFSLNDGDKMAIIGEEGNGKSTLLKAILDPNLVANYCVVKGEISKPNTKIGYLEQKLNPNWGEYTVLDYFLKENFYDEVDVERYNQMFLIKNTLKNLNFDTKHLDNDTLIKHLSGGEKVKLQLAKLWINENDVLFLDEPTNDLDIETLEILEKYILNTKKPILFISHDETLLENTANIILHIEQLIKKTTPKFTLKKCSYSEYVDTRKRQLEHQTQIAYSERRERNKKEEVLRQIKQKVENALVSAKKDPSSGRIIAKKMANVKAQERRLENDELTEIPDVEEAIKLIVNREVTLPSQKLVLNLNLQRLTAGEKELSKNIDLKIYGPQKIAIIGKNGSGKTTLLREIVSQLKETSNIKVGYFSQNYGDVLNYDISALEEMQKSSGKLNPSTLLGSMKFTREEMLSKVSSLSEGQKAKLAIIKLIIENNNVLVLDEPTRNLSPLSNPIIREVLKEYSGAIIAVSHDRKFINEICDIIYVLDKDGLKEKQIDKTSDINL